MSNNQCAECGNTFRSQIVWKSEVTVDLVKNINASHIDEMVLALNEAVMTILSDYEVA
jgi:hypothetical protein